MDEAQLILNFRNETVEDITVSKITKAFPKIGDEKAKLISKIVFDEIAFCLAEKILERSTVNKYQINETEFLNEAFKILQKIVEKEPDAEKKLFYDYSRETVELMIWGIAEQLKKAEEKAMENLVLDDQIPF